MTNDKTQSWVEVWQCKNVFFDHFSRGKAELQVSVAVPNENASFEYKSQVRNEVRANS